MSDNVAALAVVPTADPSALNAQDLNFLQAAQLSNLTEVAEARVALQNTTSIVEREFARWMIGDHSAQLAIVGTLAQQLGVTLPTAPNAKQKAEIDQLATLKGPAFNQAYGPSAVQDHAQTIALFQQEVASGKSPALIALAQQSLPLLNAHYEQAEVLAGSPPTPYPGIATPSIPNALATATILSDQDRNFVTQAATSGLAEVAEGQIAEQRGNSASSEFGRWMVADHTAVNASLAILAREQGFTVPTTVTPGQQANLARLSSTANFDSVYSSDQVLGHVTTLMTFIKEAQTGTDPALVAFAKSAIPTLEQHLAGAAELRLSDTGSSPPSGDSLGSLLSSVVAVDTKYGNTSMLSDFAGLLSRQGENITISNGTLHIGSLSIDQQQIANIFTAVRT